MKISPENAIIIYLKGIVHEVCWVNLPTRVENLEALTVCWTVFIA